MRVEKYVCSLIQGKRFYELGVVQNSIWYFVSYSDSENYIIRTKKSADKFYQHALSLSTNRPIYST